MKIEGEVLEQEVKRHILIIPYQKLIELVDQVVNWGRRSSLWPLQFGLACCAIEMICTAASRFDIARFGAELFRASPRQADLMIVSGTVTKKMVPMIARLWNQMPEPKYVIAMGACASAGGPFKEGYNVVSGIDEFLTVDVYIPGCPPTPEALLYGLIQLQKKIRGESIRTAPWYRKGEAREVPIPILGPDLIDQRQMLEIVEKYQKKAVPKREVKPPEYAQAPAIEPVADAQRGQSPPEADQPLAGPSGTVPLGLVTQLNQRFGEGTVQVARGSLLIAPDRLVAVAQMLNQELGYDYLANLSSVDYAEYLEVVYHLYSTNSQVRPRSDLALGLKVRANKADPKVPSLVSVWPGANFQEREVYDMMGIRFEGHPNLKRILMWEGFHGFPLRKDYLEPYYEGPTKMFDSRWRKGHHWRSEEHNPWHRNVSYPEDEDPGQWTSLRGPDSAPGGIGLSIERVSPELLIVNVGPQHPSTHGVFRMQIALEGERIIALEPVMGYMHRNHEKIGERNTWIMNFPYTDRLDYITSMANNLAYALAVERMLGIKPPERAEYLRVIMAELTRIVSHLWSIGFLLNDLGAFFTPALYCIEERELILDVFEMTSGARMMCNYMRFGGVSQDLPEEAMPLLKSLVHERLPKAVDELDRYLTKNEIVRARCQGIGVLPAEQAIAFSTAGPVLRGSGVAYDVRRAEPYSIYDRFQFDVVTRPGGDVYARYLVRLGEIRQSIRILQQAIEQLPPGPILAAKPMWSIRVPPGEVYSRAENPKGELGFYLVSDGGQHAYRYHCRAPSFINLTVLKELCKGHLVADVIAILGSLDIVLGEVDR